MDNFLEKHGLPKWTQENLYSPVTMKEMECIILNFSLKKKHQIQMTSPNIWERNNANCTLTFPENRKSETISILSSEASVTLIPKPDKNIIKK